ncbi:MAG: prenyltransferase [Bacteroidales bacterium]|nr:prenyltransferase [Bacteroidales bacterium]
MNHTFREWVQATRYWSFPVSVMPVALSCAYLFWQGGGTEPFLWENALLALVGIVLFHAAGNVLSDYFDFKTGVDNEQAYAVPNLVQRQFEPKEYLRFSVLLFLAGSAVGLWLTCLSGWPLLLIGGLGLLFTLAYSWMKYRALGDVDIFIVFAVLPVLGTTYAVRGAVVWEALALALPIACITLSVLHINNTVDLESDAAAGMRSVAMLLGREASVRLYLVYQLLPFLFVTLFVCLGWLPGWALLCLLAVFPAWGNLRKASGYYTQGREALLGLDRQSAKLQLVFSLSLAVGLLIAGIL